MKNELLNYIIIILIIYMVMRYIDGVTGMFLLCFFIGIPIINNLLFLVSKNNNIEISLPKNVYKNTNFKVDLEISSKNFLSLATYIVRLESTEHCIIENPDPVALIIMGKSNRKINYNLESNIAGTAEISIDIIRTDIMKMSLFGSKETIEKEIKIAYDIPTDINYSEPILKVYENIQDEPDDFETNSLTARNVAPGFEHRPYVPGDSLKKINWKLSARMNELMTRKDERTNGITIIFDVDFSLPEDGEYSSFDEEHDANIDKFLNHQLLVETALGMKEFCKNAGFNCLDMDDELFKKYNVKYTAIFSYSNVKKDIFNDDSFQFFTTNIIYHTWQILPNGELKYNG